MKKEKRLFGISVFAPVALIVVIAGLIVMLSYGREASLEAQTIPFLTDSITELSTGLVYEDTDYVISYDGNDSESVLLARNAAEILDGMGLTYNKIDLGNQSVNFDKCKIMLHCSGKLSVFGDDFENFAEWLGENNFIWLCMPDSEDQFYIVYRMLGISYCNGTYLDQINAVNFPSDFVFGLRGMEFEDLFLNDISLQVNLESDSEIHMQDLKYGNPLIWSYTRTNGSKAVVFNNNLMFENHQFTGMINAAVALCNDTLLWPIINSAIVYIDDFPAPQPEGYDERLKEQFGYDTQSFFMNRWWPDMKALAEKYGFMYTGVLVETYNDDMEPPFSVGVSDSTIKYYGAELLALDGEIAYHGYNHQPMCPEGFENNYDYIGWPSAENMRIAFQELVRYAADIFPDTSFNVYVPPSNYLSDEGYQIIRECAPNTRIISGVYYDEEDGCGYRTNFSESTDGMIFVPRVTSDFNVGDDNIIRSYCMLYSEGVFSHFFHPDDVLDEERGALLGWKKLYNAFDDYCAVWTEKYCYTRHMTASNCGGAVQRYSRIRFTTEEDDKGVTLHLSNFYDEAWFALQTENEVGSVSGGEAFTMNDDGATLTWIRCDSDTVRIDWK